MISLQLGGFRCRREIKLRQTSNKMKAISTFRTRAADRAIAGEGIRYQYYWNINLINKWKRTICNAKSCSSVYQIVTELVVQRNQNRWVEYPWNEEIWRLTSLMSQTLNFSMNVLCVRGAILDETFVSVRWRPCNLFLSGEFRWRRTEPLSWLYAKSECRAKLLFVLEGLRSAKSKSEGRSLGIS